MASQISVPFIVAAAVAILAGFVDVIRFRIPNVITVPFLLSGLVYHAATGGMEGLWRSVGGCVICFLIVVILYLMGVMGAGDVKFTAGIGAWLGMDAALLVFFIAALSTALYSIVILVWHEGMAGLLMAVNVVLCQLQRFNVVAKHLAGVESIEVLADRHDRRRRLVPFAAMLAAGVVAVVVWKSVFQHLTP